MCDMTTAYLEPHCNVPDVTLHPSNSSLLVSLWSPCPFETDICSGLRSVVPLSASFRPLRERQEKEESGGRKKNHVAEVFAVAKGEVSKEAHG